MRYNGANKGGENMKYHWNRWAGRIALGVVGIMTAAGGPALIHVCWQAGWGAAMPWGAGELLEYYGTILGAVLTVATVVVTVRFTRKQILRETDLESARRKWGRIEETFEGVLEPSARSVFSKRPSWKGAGTPRRPPGGYRRIK